MTEIRYYPLIDCDSDGTEKVAMITRAKRQAFISASGERFNYSGRQFTGGKICCFALVNGVKLINAALDSSA